MKNIKKEDIIYTAGFFDGEGHIGIGHGGRIEIRVVNNNKDVVNYLHDLWGGIIYKRKRKEKGNQTYDLVIVGKTDVDNFLTAVSPFLRVKKEQVSRSLKIKETIDKLKRL